MQRLRKFSVYLLGATLISGCDSSYHAFDGVSGFSYKTTEQHRYRLEYTGSAQDKLVDIETMWHHTARELCRGSAYEASNLRSTTHNPKLENPSEEIYKIEGDLQCLAPNYALHMQNSYLFGKHFAADQLERRRSSD